MCCEYGPAQSMREKNYFHIHISYLIFGSKLNKYYNLYINIVSKDDIIYQTKYF